MACWWIHKEEVDGMGDILRSTFQELFLEEFFLDMSHDRKL